jgi:prepilin-type N-terminal cleavage/methylation domain-containing protein
MLAIRKIRGNQGFTIIELTIASSIFAIILLVVAAGVIEFTRQYYKGVVTSKTQTATRNIMSEISQSVQYSSDVETSLPPSGNTKGFCVDNKTFSYILGQQINDSGTNTSDQGRHGLVVDSNATCTATTTPNVPTSAALPGTSTELLGNGMRLSALDVTDNGSGLYIIHVRVLYGSADSFVTSTGTRLTPGTAASLAASEWPKVICAGDRPSSAFCAISDLTTTVQERI